MTYSMFLSTHKLIKVCEWMTLFAIVLAFVRPSIAQRFFRNIEGHFRTVARTPRYAIAAAVLFPMLARLAMLAWYPPPNPIVHDEFSYLLQADTFAHGRVVNKTPPYWKHFETEYTLFKPDYASQYQPAQGLMLAAGEVIFGHPWWGVWLDVGLMCGTLCWALGFILPRTWALFGARIAALSVRHFRLLDEQLFRRRCIGHGGSAGIRLTCGPEESGNVEKARVGLRVRHYRSVRDAPRGRCDLNGLRHRIRVVAAAKTNAAEGVRVPPPRTSIRRGLSLWRRDSRLV